jgi:hypothetical protein
MGFADSLYSKRVVFDPNAIQEINYTPGCHSAAPEGAVHERIDPSLKLLHFKFLGADYMIDRYTALDRRLSRLNRERGFGTHYAGQPDALRAQFAEFKCRSGPVELGRT